MIDQALHLARRGLSDAIRRAEARHERLSASRAPIVRGVGLSPLPRPERLYFWFGEPIDTAERAPEGDRDPNRGLIPRLRRHLDE